MLDTPKHARRAEYLAVKHLVFVNTKTELTEVIPSTCTECAGENCKIRQNLGQFAKFPEK